MRLSMFFEAAEMEAMRWCFSLALPWPVVERILELRIWRYILVDGDKRVFGYCKDGRRYGGEGWYIGDQKARGLYFQYAKLHGNNVNVYWYDDDGNKVRDEDYAHFYYFGKPNNQ